MLRRGSPVDRDKFKEAKNRYNRQLYQSKCVVAERRSSLPDSSSGVSSRMWVRIPAVTLVSLSKTLYHNCFSSPRRKWVPVRAELVIVFD